MLRFARRRVRLVAWIEYRLVRIRKRFVGELCGMRIGGRVVDHTLDVRGFREFGVDWTRRDQEIGTEALKMAGGQT